MVPLQWRSGQMTHESYSDVSVTTVVGSSKSDRSQVLAQKKRDTPIIQVESWKWDRQPHNM